MDVVETDIAIVEAGGAGLRAAIAVADADPGLKIALISKVYPMAQSYGGGQGGSAGVVQAQVEVVDAGAGSSRARPICPPDALRRGARSIDKIKYPPGLLGSQSHFRSPLPGFELE